MTIYQLGKQPARPDPRDLRAGAYINAELAAPPASFGEGWRVTSAHRQWGMLGNDNVGDCVLAGAGHETIVLGLEGGKTIDFTAEGVLSDYSAITGYDPNDPSTDQGTNVHDALNYRRRTGIVDANGQRHKILAYASIDISNLAELYAALYAFGTVGIGIQFPRTAMDQFNMGEPWDVVPGAQIEGGHYVCLTGRRGHTLWCVTWGRLQAVTEAFLSTYLDEAWGILTSEQLNAAGRDDKGLDATQLLADVNSLN